MRLHPITQLAMSAFLLSAGACARNTDSDVAGAPQDTARVAADSATADQTQSGMTDSTGNSTLGPEAEKIRPDQGEPVTSKGDTLAADTDSSSMAQ